MEKETERILRIFLKYILSILVAIICFALLGVLQIVVPMYADPESVESIISTFSVIIFIGTLMTICEIID